MPWASAIWSMRRPYTPLSTTSIPRSRGMAEQTAASPAPDPAAPIRARVWPSVASSLVHLRRAAVLPKGRPGGLQERPDLRLGVGQGEVELCGHGVQEDT